MEKEVWRNIRGYSGYKVSNLGKVKSFKGAFPRELKLCLNRGYNTVCLWSKSKGKTFSVSQLVAMAFLGHVVNGHDLVVDHIDNNKLNNHISNLQIITARENCSKDKSRSKCKYIGVYPNSLNTWRACMSINGTTVHLGTFNNKIDAHNAYEAKLKDINNIKNQDDE